MTTLPAGTVLANRYQIIRPLGRGGMGTLYLAHDLRFERRYVALKENDDRSPASQAQFRLEAEVLATLHHPNLPAVTDHFISAGRQFLVMDYVEGENLEERVMRLGPLPEAQVLAQVRQVLDALAYLHAQAPPIIHRDVKPANIRITPAGKAILVDFGVAKYMIQGQLTAAAARAGSPGYAPIEQYAGGTDQRSDIYSMGATLYFALTGQEPPEAPLLAAGQTLPPPRQLNPAISRGAEAIILRAMQSEAGRRFQSAVEMMAALQAERTSIPANTGTQGSIARMKRGQKLILGGMMALLMLLLCGLGGWAAWAAFGPQKTLPPTATPTEAPAATTSAPVAAPETPRLTDTVAAGQPTSTPALAFTPRTPAPTSTATPTPRPTQPLPTRTPLPQAAPPQLSGPAQGGEFANPITFQWIGSLGAEQTYQVTAYHTVSGHTLQSNLLTAPSWTVDLPGDRIGEWRWSVAVMQGESAVATSSEGIFWFNPFPGSGGGGRDGGDGGGGEATAPPPPEH